MPARRSPLPVDVGLLQRFREAGTQIQWIPEVAPPRRGASRRSRRRAHLFEEEAYLELREGNGSAVAVADSGPVGALLLLLEIDRRGAPSLLTTHAAKELAGFPQGAIEARW
ncbi:MAG TPA: hypothetical protein VJS68_02780, partial [Thermoplasmata archaeon]|nr:hypothetical protein [Thermoplasmata archaeon]